MLDPGIGFGKTAAHNLALIRGLSLFHGLGLPDPAGRVAQAVHRHDRARPRRRRRGCRARWPWRWPGVAQGVQIIRVHDVAETRQALRLWQAVTRALGDRGMTRKLFGTDGVRGRANT